MSKKAIRLIMIIFALVAANLLVAFWEPSSQQLGFDPTAFSVQDTSSYKAIRITTPLSVNEVEKRGVDWVLNKKFKADPNLIRVFKSVMQRVRIRREISEDELNELLARVNQKGAQVEIVMNDGKSLFSVVGNDKLTKTYFINSDKNKGYEVEIPGYSDYIGGVFTLKTSQWRDRIIFNGNWRTIQSLKIDYASEKYEDLEINFKGDFFSVEGINELDSNQVVGYLDQFRYLQANEMLQQGDYPRYDSLRKTKPFLKMSIEDIKYENSYQLKIFPPLPDESLLLVTDNKEEMMIFSESRIQNFFAQPFDFKYNKP